MPDESLILRILQGIRDDMQSEFASVRAEIRKLREEMQAMDAENSAILGALMKDSGVIKGAVLELVVESGRMKRRIEQVEDRLNG